MLRSVVIFSLLAALNCFGLSVVPSVERVITDEFGRTIDARIVGVTATEVEVVRKADNTRFTLQLAKLDEESRAFALALFKKVEVSRPLPDTPFITALRSDFQTFDSASKRYVALPPTAYATDVIVVLAFGYQPDGENPFVPRVGRLTKKAETLDVAPVNWIYFADDAALYALVGDKLPPGHTIISPVARQRNMTNGQRVYNAYTTQWFSRNTRNDDGSLQFAPSDSERVELMEKLRKAMSPYWLAPQTYFTIDNGGRPSPYFIAVRRNGKPVSFRGVELSGSRQTVMSVLKAHASELE